MTIEAKKLSDPIGAVISGIRVQDLTAGGFSEINELWLERHVLIFRGQSLSPADQLNFASQFGEPDEYPFLDGIEGYPKITAVLKKENETINFGGVWHTDTIYQPRPPKASILYAIELPPEGGDTLFANQTLAYESLDDSMKKRIMDLKATSRSDISSVAKTRADRIKDSGKGVQKLVGVHPMVRMHDETRRKSLYVSPAHTREIVGLEEEESNSVLETLFHHQIKEEFIGRQEWRVGDVVIWDNRCTLHFPLNDYHGYKRLLHRVTLKGDIPA
jgi:taurine dioxygenase